MSQRKPTSDTPGPGGEEVEGVSGRRVHAVGEAQVRYGVEEPADAGEDQAIMEAIDLAIDGVAANLNRAAAALARIEEKLERRTA
jgi:hypothetical protein